MTSWFHDCFSSVGLFMFFLFFFLFLGSSSNTSSSVIALTGSSSSYVSSLRTSRFQDMNEIIQEQRKWNKDPYIHNGQSAIQRFHDAMLSLGYFIVAYANERTLLTYAEVTGFLHLFRACSLSLPAPSIRRTFKIAAFNLEQEIEMARIELMPTCKDADSDERITVSAKAFLYNVLGGRQNFKLVLDLPGSELPYTTLYWHTFQLPKNSSYSSLCRYQDSVNSRLCGIWQFLHLLMSGIDRTLADKTSTSSSSLTILAVHTLLSQVVPLERLFVEDKEMMKLEINDFFASIATSSTLVRCDMIYLGYEFHNIVNKRLYENQFPESFLWPSQEDYMQTILMDAVESIKGAEEMAKGRRRLGEAHLMTKDEVCAYLDTTYWHAESWDWIQSSPPPEPVTPVITESENKFFRVWVVALAFLGSVVVVVAINLALFFYSRTKRVKICCYSPYLSKFQVFRNSFTKEQTRIIVVWDLPKCRDNVRDKGKKLSTEFKVLVW